jgi:phage terminase Nu1 subunit (DNA packaging protein)
MRHVSQADFARLCGVNRSTVNRWLKAGRIEADAQGRIDPEAAQRLRIATESPAPHHQARKAQFDEARAASGMAEGAIDAPAGSQAADEDPESLEGVGIALKRATLALQQRKAEREALEVDRIAGALVDRADVEYVIGDFGATLRGLLEGLPDRLAGEIASHQGNVNAIHKSLEDVSREMLQALSAQIERRLEGLGA